MLLLGRSFVAFYASICLWWGNKNLQVTDIQYILKHKKYSEFAGIGVFVGVSTIFLRARKYQDLWFCSQNDTFLNEEWKKSAIKRKQRQVDLIFAKPTNEARAELYLSRPIVVYP